MQKARYLIAVSCAWSSAACGTEVATAVYSATPSPTTTVDAGSPGLPEKPPPCTTSKIAPRLVRPFGTVQLPEAARYKRVGYYFGFPQDERLAFSASNTNSAQVAWVNSAGTQVHVTPVMLPDFNRALDDIVIEGTELSGLVTLDDGFAVLTRRPDPGDPIAEGAGQATFLVRWQNGHERFAVPLTGSKSITTAPDNEKHDFPLGSVSIGLSGRLAFDGSQYGAYFAVRGGANDRYANISSDKLVQIDDNGQYVSGWRAACRQNLGGRLVADMGGFVPFCMSDGAIGTAGLYAVTPGRASMNRLAQEYAFSSGGYTGGNLGSAVKTPDGYVVAWASRGIDPSASGTPAAHNFHEPAIALVTKDGVLVKVPPNTAPNPRWPFLSWSPSSYPSYSTPTEDAVNVHAAPYGDKILLVWETIASPQFRSSTGFSTGNYGNTHFRLIDTSGNPASDEEVVPESIAPNGPDDIVQLSNRDLAWAFFPEDRNFTTFSAPTDTMTEIRFVRLPYCSP